uniref:Uncharacterized protein n=1 Tax=Echinococcus canadensis TaxID=519352 RepID=A0A915EZ88_9CEST
MPFTLLVHKDAVQIARLMQMSHQRNNYLCIYADLRSNKSFGGCFGGHHSYLINLVGQDFPHRNHQELIVALNGSDLFKTSCNCFILFQTTLYKGYICYAYLREFLQEVRLGQTCNRFGAVLFKNKISDIRINDSSSLLLLLHI